MSRFTSLLKVSPLPDGTSWVLLEPLTYELNHGTDDRITVPAGFITDFASVPRPLWALFPRQGYHTNAAVVHDWLYWTQRRPRSEADHVFLEAMDILGTLWSTRHLMFWAVRIFGWLAWWSNQRDQKAGTTRIMTVLPLATDPVKPRGLDRLFRSLFTKVA